MCDEVCLIQSFSTVETYYFNVYLRVDSKFKFVLLKRYKLN